MSAAEWIAQRRELLDAATEGPWVVATGALVGDDDDEATHVWYRIHSADRAWLRTGKVLDNELDQTTVEDASLIADARTSLPRALDALEAVLAFATAERDKITRTYIVQPDTAYAGYANAMDDVIRTIESALRADS